MAFIGKGGQVTELNASNLNAGTVPVARLGSGTADSSTFLRGDNTWAVVQTSVAPDVQTFNSNGTWTKPTGGQTMARIQVWGGGGGGGQYSSYGAGGGGGAYSERIMRLSELPASVSVTVGAAGNGSTNGNGGNGGFSQFGTYSQAYGGGGGYGDILVNNYGYGAGGGLFSGGNLNNPGRGGVAGFWGGGNGATWWIRNPDPYTNTFTYIVGVDTVFSGAGGAARYGGDTFSAARGISLYGGNGGTVGVAGSAPGGGGGAGAAGGTGRIVVTSF